MQFALNLVVPSIEAELTDTDFGMFTEVASSNFSEASNLPLNDNWIQKSYSQIEKDAEIDAQEGQSSALSEREFIQSGDHLRLRFSFTLDSIKLVLKNSRGEGVIDLAQLLIEKLYVSYSFQAGGSTLVNVVLPKLEVSDLRPDTPLDTSLVISSGHKASFLILTYQGSPQDSVVDIILQKPLFVAELAFLLQLTKFFVPSFTFSKSDPIKHFSFDVVLKSMLIIL